MCCFKLRNRGIIPDLTNVHVRFNGLTEDIWRLTRVYPRQAKSLMDMQKYKGTTKKKGGLTVLTNNLHLNVMGYLGNQQNGQFSAI